MNESYSEYDNLYAVDNVYGHAVELLTKVVTRGADSPVHLDIGCGYGRIAEPLVLSTGLSYVGVDASSLGVESLRKRGFEAHEAELSGDFETYNTLNKIVGQRSLASITFLDTIEHLVDGDLILKAIGRLAQERNAYCVISTPNVAHRDIGRKLVGGFWDYTPSGLLDHTHVRLFNNKTFTRALDQAGLHIIDSKDVYQVPSDQCYPETNPFLSESNLLGSYLNELRDKVDQFGSVNQFVRLCVACRPLDIKTYVTDRHEPRPFLSVIVRTQGKRVHTLTELMTALFGQTSTDFEVLIIAHRIDVEAQIRIERVIEDCPAQLRDRTRLIRVYDGQRSRPLNLGFEEARGSYIAIMDDDDIPMAHWVETYRAISVQHKGRVLRATVVRQKVCNVSVSGHEGLRAEGKMEKIYPSEFDLFKHLIDNHSPNNGLAFPRGVFHDLGIRFDESLTTAEDWDFLMRCVAVVGIGTSDNITAVYRWWLTEENSRTLHSREEWKSNYKAILRKHDQNIFLLPKGTVSHIRRLIQESDIHLTVQAEAMKTEAALREEVIARAAEIVQLQEQLQESGIQSSIQVEALRVEAVRREEEIAREAEIVKLQEQLLKHLQSSSWRLTAPLRVFSRLTGKKTLKFNIREKDPNLIKLKIRKIRRTISWKLSKPLRSGTPRWWDKKPNL
jgi:2-polyprenyl-3-methyl-5-hydroxy-6-metoxy-1,4-benzoquinol methylase/glycosyltransferase involved in cell wall biosynthesis